VNAPLWSALALAAGSTAAAFLAVALLEGRGCPLIRLWGRFWAGYAAWAEAETRALFLRWTPARCAALHVAATALGGLAGAALGGWPLVLPGAALLAGAGFRWPERRRRRRRRRLEAQLDPALRSMAQTLRVTANLTDALETVARQSEAPMAEEIDLCLRQSRLGLSMEEALRQMGERSGSASLETAMGAILIGRATGGDLPGILDETAATLRERTRLDGLVETRTAEGKTQAWVMGLVPPTLAAMLWHLDPDMIRPLFHDPAGWVILAAVGVLEVIGVWGVCRVTAIEV
jgi:tight adherence protein B